MPRYIVSIPVTVICTFTVEADDEDAAAANGELDDAFYVNAGGGISCREGARISAPTSEQADWDKIDVVLADE